MNNSLGDYLPLLPNRVLSTHGMGMETGMPGDLQDGPMNIPITERGPGCPAQTPDTDDQPTLLRAINDSLIAICQQLGAANRFNDVIADMTAQAANRAAQLPQDAISFIVSTPNGTVSVPPAATAGDLGTLIAQATVPEHCIGVLLRIAPQVDPVGAAGDVNWQVRVDGSAHPGLNGPLPVNAMKEHLPFFFKIPPGKTLELVAVNNGANNVNCSGFLIGYYEPIKQDDSESTGGFMS